LVFITQCIYPNRVKAALIYKIGAKSYEIVLHRGNSVNDLSVISFDDGGKLSIDTEGGVGKIEGIAGLFDWLLLREFKTVTKAEFPKELARPVTQACPGKYPFSPP
jgi:hypothetical protein